MSSDLSQQRSVYYQGRVQGVGFRYTTRRIAARFQVTGYVRNLPDGRVLLVAEGVERELNRFFREIRDELGQFVEDETTTIGPATAEFRQFDIRF